MKSLALRSLLILSCTIYLSCYSTDESTNEENTGSDAELIADENILIKTEKFRLQKSQSYSDLFFIANDDREL